MTEAGRLWLGIDLGGTNTRLGLVDREGLRAMIRFSTQAEAGPADWLGRLSRAARELIARSGGQKPAGCGVASPGVLDRDQGTVLFSPNLPAMKGFGLAGAVAEELGCPAALENDANCYALGEHRFGAGQGRDLACFTLGTGVGGGLIMDGRLVTGPMGTGGELGHSLAVSNGRRCGCGAPGCVEAYASATGLTGMLAEALDQGRDTVLSREAGAQVIAEAARAGDALAGEMMDLAGRALGAAMANVVVFAGLDLMVVGGGISPAWPLMEPAARLELADRLRIADPGRVEIVTARLGDEAPLMGAALVARQAAAQAL